MSLNTNLMIGKDNLITANHDSIHAAEKREEILPDSNDQYTQLTSVEPAKPKPSALKRAWWKLIGKKIVLTKEEEEEKRRKKHNARQLQSRPYSGLGSGLGGL